MIGAYPKIDFPPGGVWKRVILGGRNSSIWTHNRQRTLPVTIGDKTYVGSEIRVAPGVQSLLDVRRHGSVITKPFETEYKLIAGVRRKR